MSGRSYGVEFHDLARWVPVSQDDLDDADDLNALLLSGLAVGLDRVRRRAEAQVLGIPPLPEPPWRARTCWECKERETTPTSGYRCPVCRLEADCFEAEDCCDMCDHRRYGCPVCDDDATPEDVVAEAYARYPEDVES